MPEHGGRLRQAAERYQRPLGQWLDLSTGINPQGWPVPAVPGTVWQRLPESDDGLEQAAAAYYGTDSLLPVAGSQAAINLLPQLRSHSRVGVLSPGYSEHAHAWRSAGHQVIALAANEIAPEIAQLDVLLLCRPNNPDGLLIDRGLLLQWLQQLSARGGWLVIDEAFVDVTPEQSLSDLAGSRGLIMLRSLGKFFGLAGARVGFVLADQALLQALQARLGPWSLSGPARWVATQALGDHEWQATAREQLKRSGQCLVELLTRHQLAPIGGTPLFQLVAHEKAAPLYDTLARQGILLRLFSEPSALRFGLPGDEVEWQRLDSVLESMPPGHG